MGFDVFDYRTVDRNVLVTPEIRARLYHMKPGQVDRRHSHDLGHEVFLILEGEAEFTINGETRVLGPGQMCVALADEIHQVRNLLPDRETVMYLSVSPHIQPTHTGRNDDDSPQPPLFAPNANYHAETDLNVPMDLLLERHLEAAQVAAEAAQANLERHRAMVHALRQARSADDLEAAATARNAMWETLYTLFKAMYALGSTWNEVAPRMTEPRPDVSPGA